MVTQNTLVELKVLQKNNVLLVQQPPIILIGMSLIQQSTIINLTHS